MKTSPSMPAYGNDNIYYDYKERIDREYCDDGLQLEGHMCVKIETKNAMSK